MEGSRNGDNVEKTRCRVTLNREKCKFSCGELKYSGLIISKDEIKTDETKVRAIVEMKSPRNSKEVSTFLEAQHAFDVVKAFSKAPVFKMSGFQKVSRVAYGSQFNRCRSGSKSGQKPVLFASFTLSSADRNYNVADRSA
ncbi:hypothetical protein TNCV_293501 [Trichonephila clavipes]|nr:hypothetical protein TNCV_293501 [Trichonephila clavipes]